MTTIRARLDDTRATGPWPGGGWRLATTFRSGAITAGQVLGRVEATGSQPTGWPGHHVPGAAMTTDSRPNDRAASGHHIPETSTTASEVLNAMTASPQPDGGRCSAAAFRRPP